MRRHMMKFFNADNVALTISELSEETRRTIAVIADAEGGSAAYTGDPDSRRVRIDSDGTSPPVSRFGPSPHCDSDARRAASDL